MKFRAGEDSHPLVELSKLCHLLNIFHFHRRLLMVDGIVQSTPCRMPHNGRRGAPCANEFCRVLFRSVENHIALRVRADFLTARVTFDDLLSSQISITHTQSLRDAFPAEVVKLSPPKLRQLELRGSNNLKQFVCSPISSCPSLSSVDLSDCDGLDFTLIQSASLEHLNLARCSHLVKALVHCRNLSTLRLDGCEALHTLILWSDSLTDLDLSSCTKLSKLKLYCPKLSKDDLRTPNIDSVSMAVDTHYLPISELLVENFIAVKQSEVTRADSPRHKPVGSEPAISFVHAHV